MSYCFLFLFVLEKYWINIVLYCFLCWNRLLFCLGIILEKYYWFNIVFFFCWNTIGKVWVSYCFLFLFVLEKYWINIGLCCFSCWKRLLFDWNNFGKVLV